MKFPLVIVLLFCSHFLFAQTQEIKPSENLTIEWDESLGEIMESKENPITPPKPPPAEIPTFCKGVRIQVFYGKNRQEAEKKLKEVKAKITNTRANLEYFSPDYKVKVGYFNSGADAEATLKQLKSKFPSSLIVEESFRCRLMD